MNKNKKIMTYLTIGALVLAFVSIFMGFAGGWTNSYYIEGQLIGGPTTIQFWKIIFNEKNVVVDGFGGTTNAALVIAFVLTIISVLGLATTVVLNFINKSSKKLNKGLMIALIVILFVVGLLMILSKGVCGVADESTTEMSTIKNVLAAGPIVWGVLSVLSAVAMIVAAVQNKKAFAQA